jgi:hypothetical protein
VDAQGNGISSSQIGVTTQPTSGAGIVATYALAGSAPAGISTAVIQICVNMCGTMGANDMDVYSFQYADSGSQTSFDFSKGLDGWGIDPSGTAAVGAGFDASGPFLSVSATAAQSTYINSPSVFAVTPGSANTLTVTARISPASVGSGYFALIFGTDPSCVTPCQVTTAFQETSRDTLPFAPGIATLGTALTGSDGSYSVELSPVSASGTFQVTAYYGGSDSVWPAQATVRKDCPPGSLCLARPVRLR